MIILLIIIIIKVDQVGTAMGVLLVITMAMSGINYQYECCLEDDSLCRYIIKYERGLAVNFPEKKKLISAENYKPMSLFKVEMRT